jgi:hypothetical protein
MITVLLNTDWGDTQALRYNTNSFDEAVTMVVDDWIAGKVPWGQEDVLAAFTPQWLEANGYPSEDSAPSIHKETEIVTYVWHWYGETENTENTENDDADDFNEDVIVYGHFIKSAPVQEGEWPTRGLNSFPVALLDDP